MNGQEKHAKESNQTTLSRETNKGRENEKENEGKVGFWRWDWDIGYWNTDETEKNRVVALWQLVVVGIYCFDRVIF